MKHLCTVDGVLLEKDSNIDDTQLDVPNIQDWILGHLEQERIDKEMQDALPCDYCIHCGCIDKGKGLCNTCAKCKNAKGCRGNKEINND